MKDLSERLHNLSDKKQELQHLQSHLAEISSTLTSRIREREELEQELESMDEILTQPSPPQLYNILSRFLAVPQGSQASDEIKEKYLITHLELQNCQKRIELKEYEIKIMKQKIAAFSGVEEAYQQLFNEKKQQLKFRHKDIAGEIILLESALRHQIYHQKQILEALEIGNTLQTSLTNLYDGIEEIIPQVHTHMPPEYAGHPGDQLSKTQRNKTHELTLLVQTIDKLCISFAEELQDVDKEYQFQHILFSNTTTEFLEKFYAGFVSDFIRRRGKRISLTHIDNTLKQVRKLTVMLDKELLESKEIESTQEQKLRLLVMGREIY